MIVGKFLKQLIPEKFLRFLSKEFVYGSHLLALGAVGIILTLNLVFSINMSWGLLIAVFLGTYSIYLYNHFKEFGADSLTNSERTRHIAIYRKHIPLIILCSILIFVSTLLFSNKVSTLFFGLGLLILGLLYSEFLKRVTRKVIFFKTFFVASMWTLLTILFVFYYSFSFNIAFYLILIFIFMRSFLHTSFFDIKDIKLDKEEELKTLPIILKEKFFCYFNFLNILSITPIIFGVYSKLLPSSALMLLLTVPYAIYCFEKIRAKNACVIRLSYIFTGGEKILWPILVSLGKLFL